jgi:hypothetical protein
MQVKDQNPFYVTAEIVDEQPKTQTGIDYDFQQVEENIKSVDGQTGLFKSICQGAVLAGSQMIATQYLYQIGIVGMFPAFVAAVPVGASLSATLTQLRFSNSVIPTINDPRKFAQGLSRTSILFTSSLKLTGDANEMDRIARESFTTYTAQKERYEGVKPQGSNFGVYLVAGVLLLSGIVAFFKNK